MHYNQFFNLPGAMFGVAGAFVGLLVLWEVVWKGQALWKAARNNEPLWFVALLILNTVGILPILYIYVFAKDRKDGKKSVAA